MINTFNWLNACQFSDENVLFVRSTCVKIKSEKRFLLFSKDETQCSYQDVFIH